MYQPANQNRMAIQLAVRYFSKNLLFSAMVKNQLCGLGFQVVRRRQCAATIVRTERDCVMSAVFSQGLTDLRIKSDGA